MSVTYKITLKPIDGFYFGGEDSFSSAPLNAVNNQDPKAKRYFQKRQGYFAKSEKFPQQTQLLGMLRKELLRHNKKLLYFKNFLRVPKVWKEDAKCIVGIGKWSASNNLDLGEMQQLSPLYLCYLEQMFIPTPKDYGLSMLKDGEGYINGRAGSAIAFQKSNGNFFGAKDYLSSAYISKSGDTIDIDEIFKAYTQIQTQILCYKEDNTEQLYKVKKYRLKEGYSFVCYLTMSSDKYIDNFSTTVELGGERSSFEMMVTKQSEPNIKDEYKYLQTDKSRLVLLSDTYVDDTIFDKCDIVLSEKKILRTFTIDMQNSNQFTKDTKIILLGKGTVFYPREGEGQAIKDMIEKYTNYTTIGYNQYLDLTQGEKR